MKTTLDEMQAFIAIVTTGSISAAAEQLGLTVSAASRTLSRLEEKLETTLVRRTTRRLELTEEGQAFLDCARSIIEKVEETEEKMSLRRQGPAGRLRIDAATPFMLHIIVPLVNGYRERFPRVELELNSNEGFIDLMEKRTDVAFRIGRLKDSTLHATPIGSSRLRVLASPEYLQKYSMPATVADLANHTLLGFNQPSSLNEWPLPDSDGQPLNITPQIYSSSGETLLQLALKGAGIVCLSDFMTCADRKSGRLQQLLTAETLEVRQPINAVYYRNTALSARIASFVGYMKEKLGDRGFDEPV
ncbi:LysR family transcriptional regulator [Pseudoduganella eburnea]|uniref:LysR family transcriptional regulator n=1 Tax=Massilia eburnea TaxID=1776165 RepID=A0A6L6QNT8_9BURK|nr:LysR family transcriptional regulator [Massilia eburnea]MTW13855.1 LysR family transcriptional regulator [Massilia eburnea]